MTATLPNAATLEARKDSARTWFERLRDEFCAALEAVEDALPKDAPLADQPAGRFQRTPWHRADHTGQPAPQRLAEHLAHRGRCRAVPGKSIRAA